MLRSHQDLGPGSTPETRRLAEHYSGTRYLQVTVRDTRFRVIRESKGYSMPSHWNLIENSA